MKILFFLILLLAGVTRLSAQTSTEYIILNHRGYPSKVGFPVVGKIKFKWHKDGLVHHETIVALSDTSFSFIENGTELKTTVLFNEVARIYYPKRHIPVLSSSGEFLGASAMFTLIDILNQATTSRPVKANPSFLAITALLIPIHLLSYHLNHPSYRVSPNHFIKLIKVNKTMKSI